MPIHCVDRIEYFYSLNQYLQINIWIWQIKGLICTSKVTSSHKTVVIKSENVPHEATSISDDHRLMLKLLFGFWDQKWLKQKNKRYEDFLCKLSNIWFQHTNRYHDYTNWTNNQNTHHELSKHITSAISLKIVHQSV